MLWTLRGKTAWETGVILGIAESTVVKIARSASLKLGAPNKRCAALKAMKLGLLDEAEVPAECVAAAALGVDTGTGHPACDPQCWSRVGVQPGVLASLTFTHLATDCVEKDVAQPPARADGIAQTFSLRGRTTWQSNLSDAHLYLQWVWVIDEGGVMLIENPLNIATNIDMPAVGEQGQNPRAVLLECLSVIHRLDWHELVRQAGERVMPQG